MFTEALTTDYPVLFVFEVGDWWDYLMLIIVTTALALTAWLAQRNKWVVLAVFIVAPVLLTIFWWPYSTQGTRAEGWFPIVKQYSALAGSLSLVGLQYSQKLRKNQWYLMIPPVILAINILEAVIRDFQCANIHGLDSSTGLTIWGGSWNYMNGIAGILNLLAISGWVGIFVASNKSKAVMWGDLTLGWIIAYDLWNFAYVYNCLPDRAWYSGFALLASCTIPALLPSLRGSWIQFRAYTLMLWSAVVLTFPHFMHDSMFAHRSSYNTTALFLFSFLALVINIIVFGYHVYRIATLKRNPFKVEVYSDTPEYIRMVRKNASGEDKVAIAARLNKTPEQLGYSRVAKRRRGLRTKR